MIAMGAIAVGFILWQRKEKSGAVIQGFIAGQPRFGEGPAYDNACESIGSSRPPPRPRDRERDRVFTEWLLSQQSKGHLAR